MKDIWLNRMQLGRMTGTCMAKVPGTEEVVGARCGSFGPEEMMIISLSMAFNSSKRCLVDDTDSHKLQVLVFILIEEDVQHGSRFMRFDSLMRPPFR